MKANENVEPKIELVEVLVSKEEYERRVARLVRYLLEFDAQSEQDQDDPSIEVAA